MTESKKVRSSRRHGGDRLLVLLALLYFLGVVLGTVLYCTADTDKTDILDGIAADMILARSGQSFLEILVNSFSGSFVLLLICFFLGFCVISPPAEMLIPMFRGLGAGAATAAMYRMYGLHGAGVSALLIVPNAVLSAFVLIIAARESVRFSAALYSVSFGRETERERPDVRLYYTKFIILSAGLALSAMIDSALTLVSAGTWTSLLGI